MVNVDTPIVDIELSIRGPIAKIIQLDHVKKCLDNPEGYKQLACNEKIYNWYDVQKHQIAEYALQKLEEARRLDINRHDVNADSLAHNRNLRDDIIALMDFAKIPQTHQIADPKSRGRYPKYIKVEAGYLMDLKRWIPISDGYEESEARYYKLRQIYTQYALNAEHEKQKQLTLREQEIARKQKERQEYLGLAQIIIRYSLPEDSEWEDVLEALRVKDQRLNLAVAMLLTRHNWSNGPYRVEDALSKFELNDAVDVTIQQHVSEALADYEDDGRIFRDCSWNYDQIFATIEDQTLVKDVLTVINHVSID